MQAVPLLMSVSVAAPAEDPTPDKQDSPEGFAFCVKNTFIEVFALPELPQRSVSAPATPRGAGLTPSCSPLDAWSSLQPAGALSEASTLSEASAEEQLSDDSCGESVASDAVACAIALADLLPQHTLPPRTKLSSCAKAWAPSHTVYMPPDVKSQFSDVMAAAQAALMSNGYVQEVCATQRNGHWLLEASCLQTDLPSVQLSLAVVKQAMFGSAEKSNKVRILGRQRTPFAPIHGGLGFSAQFAWVDDGTSACWDLLSTGACCRGALCRWQHPTWHIKMDVVVKGLRP